MRAFPVRLKVIDKGVLFGERKHSGKNHVHESSPHPAERVHGFSRRDRRDGSKRSGARTDDGLTHTPNYFRSQRIPLQFAAATPAEVAAATTTAILLRTYYYICIHRLVSTIRCNALLAHSCSSPISKGTRSAPAETRPPTSSSPTRTGPREIPGKRGRENGAERGPQVGQRVILRLSRLRIFHRLARTSYRK